MIPILRTHTGMRHVFLIAAVLFLLMLPPSAAGQEVELERVSMPGSDFVVDVAQDERGVMWFATQAGLVRYRDGEASVYRHDSLDAASLSHDYVEEVLVDREGVLWVGTYGGGLNRYDRETDTFVRYRHDPEDSHSLSHDNTAALFEDGDGVIWVGTRNGLNRLDRKSGRFTRFQHDAADPASLSDNWARAIHEDGRGRLWIGTHDGLNLMDRDRGTFTRFLHDPDDPATLTEGRVSAILEDRSGRLWVGTGRSEGGLNVLDAATGSVTRYAFDGESSDWPVDPQPEGPWTGGGFTDILQDTRGVLWFSNWEGWVSGFNPETGRVVNYNIRDLAQKEAHPFSIFESDDGALWFGSVEGPLFRTRYR